jgi:hypothetical protein
LEYMPAASFASDGPVVKGTQKADRSNSYGVSAAIQSNLRETTTRVLASVTKAIFPRSVNLPAVRRTRAAHALRHRREHQSHAGGSRPAILGHARKNPPDSGGAAPSTASQPAILDYPQAHRQIEAKTLRNLKHSARRRRLQMPTAAAQSG